MDSSCSRGGLCWISGKICSPKSCQALEEVAQLSGGVSVPAGV